MACLIDRILYKILYFNNSFERVDCMNIYTGTLKVLTYSNFKNCHENN